LERGDGAVSWEGHLRGKSVFSIIASSIPLYERQSGNERGPNWEIRFRGRGRHGGCAWDCLSCCRTTNIPPKRERRQARKHEQSYLRRVSARLVHGRILSRSGRAWLLEPW